MTDGSGDTGTDASDGSGGTSGSADTTGGDDGPMQSGVDLFLSLCSPCHGLEGEGTELAYELRHPVREYATWVIRNGRPGEEFPSSVMSPYPDTVVSDAQLEEIFDWLDAFPQPQTGEALYLDYCRNCHGADPDQGGVVHKEIGGNGYGDVLERNRQGSGGTDYGARTLYMPARGPEILSDEELMLISEYILSN